MDMSESIDKLSEALSKAQGEIENAKRDSDNPFFKSKYADLASVTAACRNALSKHGIAIVQAPETDADGSVTVTTVLAASGQWMRSTMRCKPGKTDAQSIGSVITYLRRYALAAMVGVAPEDDDGEAAVGRGADEDKKKGPDMAPTGTRQPPTNRREPHQDTTPEHETIGKEIKLAIDSATEITALNKQMIDFGIRPGPNNPPVAGSKAAKLLAGSEAAYKFLIDRLAKRRMYLAEAGGELKDAA